MDKVVANKKSFEMVNAYECGKEAAKRNLVLGEVFMGGMNIADGFGFKRKSLEWEGAMLGAMIEIKSREIWTNKEGVIVKLI